MPGLSLHYEMQLLTDMGITPMKAIQGATLWSAEVVGQQKDIGSVETGKLAWYFQYTPNDSWDFDEIGVHMLYDAKIGGVTRKV